MIELSMIDILFYLVAVVVIAVAVREVRKNSRELKLSKSRQQSPIE